MQMPHPNTRLQQLEIATGGVITSMHTMQWNISFKSLNI